MAHLNRDPTIAELVDHVDEVDDRLHLCENERIPEVQKDIEEMKGDIEGIKQSMQQMTNVLSLVQDDMKQMKDLLETLSKKPAPRISGVTGGRQ